MATNFAALTKPRTSVQAKSIDFAHAASTSLEITNPTFLRKEPHSFNFKQLTSAFYPALGLRNSLDTKVLEWVESCPSMAQSVLTSILKKGTSPN